MLVRRVKPLYHDIRDNLAAALRGYVGLVCISVTFMAVIWPVS
jgi:hypothetical protein